MSAMNEVTLEMLERLNEELASEQELWTSSDSIHRLPSADARSVSILDHLVQCRAGISSEDIVKFESVLAFLPSDIPRGNGTFFDLSGHPVADYWLGVIWVGASLGDASVKDKLREWSKRSARYDEKGFEAAWKGYNPKHTSPVGMGSLLKFAKAKGWSDPTTPLGNLRASQNGYTLLNRAGIMSLPATPWRVKRVFPQTGLGAIYGPSASGKSFLAMDLACTIAGGETWFGYKTSACPVTYLVLEGEAGLPARIQAWEKGRGKSLPENFYVIRQSFLLTDLGNLKELLAVLPKNGVVFLDTLNRAAPTSDENSSADMGEVLQAAKNLQLATNGLVIVVHHTGKDVSKGMRGHSSLFAALDGAIEVQRSDGKRSWSVAKSKDAEDGNVMVFRLERHVVGYDADGEEITSCSIEPDTAQLFIPREPSGAKQKAALKAIRQAISFSTHFGEAGSGAGTPCMTMKDVKVTVASILTTEVPNKRMNRAKSLIEGLIIGSYLGTGIDIAGEGWVWTL
jgi:hypothetical protein